MPAKSAQPQRGVLDDLEERGAEGPDQLAGIDRANPPDPPRSEVTLDAGQRRRWRDADEQHAELPAMFATSDPLAGGRGVFSG